MRKRLLTVAFFVAGLPAMAAELSGIALPDEQDVAGTHLVLNGIALRTFSFLRLHIYVAGLYLERRSSDPDTILRSDEYKLLRFTFLRDVGQLQARGAWRDSLNQSCRSPCQLPPSSVDAFLASVPALHSGDTSVFAFTPHGLEVTMNGRLVGKIDDPLFVHVVLMSFIGPHPTAPDVKHELLGSSPG